MSMCISARKNHLPCRLSCIAVLALLPVWAIVGVGTLIAGEEKPPEVAVHIIKPYPINNKVLIGGQGDNVRFKAEVTPADVGTYTWSYAKDLSWKPNGAANANITDTFDMPDPFPDTKDSEKMQVLFTSTDGKGSSTDQRPLNYVAPEHFANGDSNQPPTRTQKITTDAPSVEVTVYRFPLRYSILDQYKDVIASTTAYFPSSNHVQTMEAANWTSIAGIPKPTIQSTWEHWDAGRLPDTILVRFPPNLLMVGAQFNSAFLNMEIVSVTAHVWKARAKHSTGHEYQVTNNQLSVKLTRIFNGGRSADITTSYTVNVQ